MEEGNRPFDNLLKPPSNGSTSSQGKTKDKTSGNKVTPLEDPNDPKNKDKDKKEKEKKDKEKKDKEKKEKDKKGKDKDKDKDDKNKSTTRKMIDDDPFSSIWNIDDMLSPVSDADRKARAKDVTGARKVKSQEEKNLFATNTTSESYLDLFNNSFNSFAPLPANNNDQGAPATTSEKKKKDKKEKKKSDKSAKLPALDENKALVDNTSTSSLKSNKQQKY